MKNIYILEENEPFNENNFKENDIVLQRTTKTEFTLEFKILKLHIITSMKTISLDRLFKYI